jgi:hypothetical protein
MKKLAAFRRGKEVAQGQHRLIPLSNRDVGCILRPFGAASLILINRIRGLRRAALLGKAKPGTRRLFPNRWQIE